MTAMEDIRRTVSESRPMRAAIGATDLAVERAKEAWEKASSPEAKEQAKEQAKERLSQVQKSIGDAVTGFDPQAIRVRVTGALDTKTLQSTASQLPGWAVAGVLQVAGKAESQYESLAERGKVLLDRAKNDPHSQDLMGQGKQAVDRTKTAVVTVRKKVDVRTASARTAMSRVRDAAASAPESSAASEPTDEMTAEETPVATPPKAEPAVTATDQVSEGTTPEDAPVATPPEKPASPRKKTSSAASSTEQAKKTPAKKTPARKTSAKKASTSRSSTGSGRSTTSANGRAQAAPRTETDTE